MLESGGQVLLLLFIFTNIVWLLFVHYSYCYFLIILYCYLFFNCKVSQSNNYSYVLVCLGSHSSICSAVVCYLTNMSTMSCCDEEFLLPFKTCSLSLLWLSPVIQCITSFSILHILFCNVLYSILDSIWLFI